MSEVVDRFFAENDAVLIKASDEDQPRSAPWRINISTNGIDRAYRILAGFDGALFQRAVGSAAKRALKHGETVGYRAAAERYYINSGVLKGFTRHYNSEGNGGWRLGYKGNLIPLNYYDVRYGSEGKLKARVRRGNSYVTFRKAFISSGVSYDRVRERVGKERYPTKQLFGPSAVQAIAIEKDKVADAVQGEFDKRIEHEILRIMNGWGV